MKGRGPKKKPVRHHKPDIGSIDFLNLGKDNDADSAHDEEPLQLEFAEEEPIEALFESFTERFLVGFRNPQRVTSMSRSKLLFTILYSALPRRAGPPVDPIGRPV